MHCVNLIDDGMTIQLNNEWEAEQFVLQMLEWTRTCSNRDRCPASRLFQHLAALKEKSDRLERELKLLRDRPDEN